MDVTNVGPKRKQPAPDAVLRQNSPNPFNPITTIEFEIPGKQWITLDVFDVTGVHVKRMIDRIMDEGPHKVIWDGTDAYGNPAASGIYFYRMKAGDNLLARKMVLIR